MNWSEHAAKVVHETLVALPADASEKEKRAALKAAYPFGQREYWPYRTWCRQVRLALGLIKPKRRGAKKSAKAPAELAKGQGSLFE